MIEKRYLVLAYLFCLLAFFAAGCERGDSPRDRDLRIISRDLTDWSKNWQVLKPSASGSGHKGSLSFKKIGDAPDVVAIFDGDPEVPGVLQSVALPARQGADYRLSFDLFRSRFQNGHYLSVNLFGKEFYLNNHCVAGGWQRFMVQAHTGAGFFPRIVFRNDTDSGFLLRRPALELVHQSLTPFASPEPASAPGDYDFPLGTYGAGPAQLPELNACGLNAAFMSAKASKVKELLAKAQAHGVRVILSCPLDVEKIRELAKPLSGIKPDQRPIFFYLQDEPEIRSTPLEKLLEARRALQKALPWARTATAMVRPWLVSKYNPAYDAIFMDQYPVPTQPMNWLADSIRQARRLARPGTQIWAVIQAFGGGKHAGMGWPRLPTAAEMGALAGEALAEGAQGLLFYTWDAEKQTPGHQKNICSLVTRLRLLKKWLPLTPGLPPGLGLEFWGRVKSDAGGSPAVRLGWRKVGDKVLVLGVNPTRYDVRVRLIGLDGYKGYAPDIWSGLNKALVGGELREVLKPLGVRAWIFTQAR